MKVITKKTHIKKDIFENFIKILTETYKKGEWESLKLSAKFIKADLSFKNIKGTIIK